MRVSTYVRAWLAGLPASGLATTSFERYTDGLISFLEAFGRRQMRTVAVLELRLWVAGRLREASVATVRLEGTLVRRLFRDALLQGVLRRSPAVGLRLPPARRDPLPLSLSYDAARGAIDACRRVGAPWREGLSLLLESGLRLGELLSLRWVDVLDSALYIRPHEDGWRPKSGSRAVPCSRRGARDIAALRLAGGVRSRDVGDPHVFPATGASRAVGARLRRRLRWVCESASLPVVSPHKLRHLFGTHLFEVGAPAPVVQALMGHHSLELTQLYSHVTPQLLVAAMGRF